MPKKMSANIDETIAIMKRKAFDRLKTVGFQHNGTIFGGFVRDEYIAEFYTNKYNRLHENRSKYWDPKHSPETKARLLIPKDMDISFRQQQDADDFIGSISEIDEFKIYVTDRLHDTNKYNAMQSVLFSIKEITIYMRIGHIPFIEKGRSVKISVDVVVPNNSFLQPPFNNLDMLCNGFILTEHGGKQFSRNTGTIFDHYNDYERAVVVPQILKDMIEFKTYICMTTSVKNKRLINVISLNRIQKMLKKQIPWTMLNMPFKNEVYTAVEGKHEDCSICFDQLSSNQMVAYTSSSKESDDTEIPTAKVHLNCMMHHLHYQKQNADRGEGRIFVFSCPFRNKISFTRCKLDLQFAYKKEL
jgi:hypothetical protein